MKQLVCLALLSLSSVAAQQFTSDYQIIAPVKYRGRTQMQAITLDNTYFDLVGGQLTWIGGTNSTSIPPISPTGNQAPAEEPSTWALTAMPATSAGTPTISDCTTLVNAIAAKLAQRMVSYSVVLRNVYRGTVTGHVANDSVTVGPLTASLAASSVTRAVPVDVVNANPAILDSLINTLALQELTPHTGGSPDSDLLNMFPLFSNNASVGAPGTPLTTAVLDSVAANANLNASGEPIFLVLNQLPTVYEGSWNYKNVRILVSLMVPMSGSGPTTTHNLAFNPSSLGLISNIATPVNDSTHAQAVSTYGNISVLVSITNTGSGVQTVTVTMLYGTGVLNANRGLQVNS